MFAARLRAARPDQDRNDASLVRQPVGTCNAESVRRSCNGMLCDGSCAGGSSLGWRVGSAQGRPTVIRRFSEARSSWVQPCWVQQGLGG